MAKIDHLSALTVCIYYSDFLEIAIANKIHFDAWLVLTCRDDVRTISLCAEHDVACACVEFIGNDGAGFDSAFNKAEILNYGLSLLDSSAGWVVILDADLLLPSDFRDRLNSLTLYPRALYGLYGRREVETWDEFVWRRQLEPWAESLGHSDNILGFFQLFRLDQPQNRYPLFKRNPEMHDDVAFQYSFKPSLRRKLPLTGLHVGPAESNWYGRISTEYQKTGSLSMPECSIPSAVANLVARRR